MINLKTGTLYRNEMNEQTIPTCKNTDKSQNHNVE